MRYLRIGTIIVFIAALVALCVTVVAVTRTDRVAPVITDEIGTLHLKAADEDTMLLQGLHATDDRDGDISHKIVVERVSRFSEPGVCKVSYVVYDSNHNLCRYQRTVCYDDYTAPRLSLEKPLVYHAGDDIVFMDRLKLTDCLDGDLTYKLKLESSNVVYSEVGVYEIEVSAVTNYGDEVYARLPVNIITYAAQAPVISLKQNLVYVKKGEPFDPKEYITDVKDCNGFPIDVSAVFVFSQVNTAEVGAGQVRMETTDGYGRTGVTYLTVIVEE